MQETWLTQLSKKLKNYPYRRRPLKNFTASAVLIPLLPTPTKTQIIFTERNGYVRDHKHQIAYPGGMKERTDKSLLATALRECEEEIGLQSKDVTVLGRLNDLYTPTGYRISPFVGLLKPSTRFCVDPRETEKLLRVPLDALLNPKNFRLQKAEFFSKAFDLPFYHYRGHVIWGATGRMTREFLGLTGHTT